LPTLLQQRRSSDGHAHGRRIGWTASVSRARQKQSKKSFLNLFGGGDSLHKKDFAEHKTIKPTTKAAAIRIAQRSQLPGTLITECKPPHVDQEELREHKT